MHADWSYNYVIPCWAGKAQRFCNRFLSKIEPTQDLPSMDIRDMMRQWLALPPTSRLC